MCKFESELEIKDNKKPKPLQFWEGYVDEREVWDKLSIS